MKSYALALLLLLPQHLQAQDANPLERIPNLKALPDVTELLQQRIDQNAGNLLIADQGNLRITRPLVFDLKKYGAVTVKAVGGATIIMDGPGAALQLVGSHTGTSSPNTFKAETWNERMPLISGIEIVGVHPESDGIELLQTMEATIDRVSVRWCRHGIRMINRNRNVVVANCHLYENSGVGVYLDDVNLHQINVIGSHISYNRGGGIVVREGNVRNLQVSGCDIEGNMPTDETPTTTANILVDVSGSPKDRSKSVAEITITGCTIQHAAHDSASEHKSVAVGSANIRLAGKKIYPIDSVTITGNVLSDTTVNIDIDYADDVTINGNNFFAPKPTNIRGTNSRRIVVSGNTFNPRQFTRPGTILFRNCQDCLITNSTIHKFSTDAGAVILERCSGFTIASLNLSDCGSGIVLRDTTDTTIANCRVIRTAAGSDDISIDGTNRNIVLSGNAFGGATSVDSSACTASK